MRESTTVVDDSDYHAVTLQDLALELTVDRQTDVLQRFFEAGLVRNRQLEVIDERVLRIENDVELLTQRPAFAFVDQRRITGIERDPGRHIPGPGCRFGQLE